MFTLLAAIVVVGWIAAAVVGTQVYFRGEQSKPIHERNWNSESFERIAQIVTGEGTDYTKRVATFSSDAFTSKIVNS